MAVRCDADADDADDDDADDYDVDGVDDDDDDDGDDAPYFVTPVSLRARKQSTSTIDQQHARHVPLL